MFAVFLAFLDFENPFPIFGYAAAPSQLISVDLPSLGQAVGQFLWSYRVLDLIALAFMLFAAAACCVAMTREEKEDEERSP